MFSYVDLEVLSLYRALCIWRGVSSMLIMCWPEMPDKRASLSIYVLDAHHLNVLSRNTLSLARHGALATMRPHRKMLLIEDIVCLRMIADVE